MHPKMNPAMQVESQLMRLRYRKSKNAGAPKITTCAAETRSTGAATARIRTHAKGSPAAPGNAKVPYVYQPIMIKAGAATAATNESMVINGRFISTLTPEVSGDEPA
jgi:hypothetical protein